MKKFKFEIKGLVKGCSVEDVEHRIDEIMELFDFEEYGVGVKED